MEKLSALIVDDEEKAVALMVRLLHDTGEFMVLREAYSVAGACKILAGFDPDLIFLDIRMPGQSGFELMKTIREQNRRCEVVFVTAFDEYTIDAIRNHAFGYLLKPVNRNELNECLHDFKLRKKTDTSIDQRLHNLLVDIGSPPKIRINTRAGYFFVHAHEILYCQAEGNYTAIELGDKRHVCSLNLGQFEKLLPVNGFVRLGRSIIVNIQFISEVDRKNAVITFEKEKHSYQRRITRQELKELDRIQEQY